MINQNKLKEKLRSIYFELISDISPHSYEKLLSILANRLHVLLNATYAGIYIYSDSGKQYNKMIDKNEALIIPHYITDINKHLEVLDIQKSDGAFINREIKFVHQPQGTKSFILRLEPKHEPTGFLLLVFDDKVLSDALLRIIKVETDNLLNIVNYYKLGKDSDKRNEFLFDLSSRLHSSTDKTEILTKIIESLEMLYPTYSYSLLLSHDYESDNTLPVKLIEYSDDATKRSGSQAFITGEVQIEDRLKTRDTCLYAPLSGSQGVYGVIQIITPQVTEFKEREIEFITQLSRTAGRAMESAILYQNSIHLVSDLKLINEATHKLNSNLKLSELVTILKKQIIDICNATEIGFIYYNEESIDEFDVLPGSTSFLKSEQGLLFVEHLARQMAIKTESIFNGDYTKKYKNSPYYSMISIPMIHAGLNRGFIIILHEKRSFFTFENFKLMQSLIHHSTLALTNTILKDKLKEAVITDYLTKLYSRSHLDEMLNMHMGKDEKGTLILFDIDDFKKVNDTYGHHIGDEVIIQIADIIRTNIEEEDVPARWGGEEFAIYLPQDDIVTGFQLADKIRKQVANLTEPGVTFSCGVSTWVDKHTDSVTDIFIRADEALYEAKEIGKNRVICN